MNDTNNVSSKYKIVQEYTTFLRKTKEYVLDVNGKEITVRKWWEEDEVGINYDCDWEYATLENKQAVEKMGDEVADELYDFISDLN